MIKSSDRAEQLKVDVENLSLPNTVTASRDVFSIAFADSEPRPQNYPKPTNIFRDRRSGADMRAGAGRRFRARRQVASGKGLFFGDESKLKTDPVRFAVQRR